MNAATSNLRLGGEDAVVAIEERIRLLSTARLGVLLRELRESAAATKSAPIQATPAVHTTSAVAAHTVAADCATALAYLAAHAKPGFAHYCRPGHLTVGITNAVAYTCVPGPGFACPDGNAEIIIADPACAVTYENEASNSYWDFSTGAVIQPGATQDGRTWDPYGECT